MALLGVLAVPLAISLQVLGGLSKAKACRSRRFRSAETAHRMGPTRASQIEVSTRLTSLPKDLAGESGTLNGDTHRL